MVWNIEIRNKPGVFDAVGFATKKDIEDLGIKTVRKVEFIQAYLLKGSLDRQDADRICRELLVDPITQDYLLTSSEKPASASREQGEVIEVAYNPGVMDPVEASLKKAIQDLDIKGVDGVKTAKKYILTGEISPRQKEIICDKLLVNKVIQHVVKPETPLASEFKVPAPGRRAEDFKPIRINIREADEKTLEKISREGQLFLNLGEMKAIQEHFRRQKREPTDVELETLAQTWSEHCVHKTFRGLIEYEGELIDNLLKSTVMKATKELNKGWCVSVFKDNSGIIRFDNDYNICFKVETHNHPSALEPYGGANTGIGGVIRDPLGTGLGARPILNTDVFCFGPPDLPQEKVPAGGLHPRRIMKGVVAGVRDYGNRMGIPTANGAVLFDEGYTGNPLVYCGTLGIMPRGMCEKRLSAGDKIVLIGGRTGRDGIHGATFSSGELTEESEKISSGAVQIGNPITEKKMVDTLLQARDKKLYKAITDCGGGGLSSAVGEMGKTLGARVDLEKVPLKYEGLSYTEIWISEAQERMILAVAPDKVEKIIPIFASEDVEATVIGEFTGTGRLELFYSGNPVLDLEMKFLHQGFPRLKRQAEWKKPVFPELPAKSAGNLGKDLKQLLSSWNVCSKEWVIRQYDHEVQGASVLKPLVGIENDGPSDACIIRPLARSKKGVIVSCGINPRYGLIDPYWMAAAAIDEALRQIIAVGGSLKEVALLDNFCWGNPNIPDRLGGLVRAARACYDMALAFGAPFISGKDSLNNEYQVGGESVPIPATLLISAVGIMEDVEKAISMDFKNPGDFIYLVGPTYDELGGSHYYQIQGSVGNRVPRVRPEAAKKIMDTLAEAVSAGTVLACHDLSEGGLGVAAAEMAFSGGIGAELSLRGVPLGEKMTADDKILFSESNSRFLVEVSPLKQKKFEKVMKGIPFGLLGKADTSDTLVIRGLGAEVVVKEKLASLKEAWKRPLAW